MRPGTNTLAVATAIALTLVTASAIRLANRVPDPLTASAPVDVFSGERAMQHVRVIAQTPHPAGSEGHARVRAYLVAELTKLGLAPQVQDVTGIGTRFPVAGRVRNVVARIPGTASGGKAILLAAHYDAVPASMGAGDDASGTAAVLETVRALKAGPPLRNDVIVLLTDAEENGLLGAAAFVSDHPWAKDVGVVMNFEGRGTGGPALMFQTGDGNLDVVRALKAAPMPNATSLSVVVYRRLPNDTDQSEFAMLGAPALNFAFIDGVERYHTAEDDVAHLDPSSVQHEGSQMLALARQFGNEPLPRPKTPDAVFFTLPGFGLVAYSEGKALPVVFAALVLVGLVLARVKRREAHAIRDIAIGAALVLLTVLIAGAVAYFFAGALAAFHGAKPLGGDPAWATPYPIAVALIAIAIVSGTMAFARRWSSAAGLHAGALVLWALVSIAVTRMEPGASFLFVWPLFVVAAATAANLPRPDARVEAALIWLATIVVLFILVPTMYTMVCVALGSDATGATILAVLAALTAWLLLPHFETMRGARPAVAPLVLGGAAVVAIGVGLVTVRTTPENPTGASFAYAVDVDSSKAWITGVSGEPSARSWLSETLGSATAGQKDHGRPSWLTAGFNQRTTFPAPFSTQATAPTAIVVKDSTGGGARYVTLRIRSAPGTLATSVAASGTDVMSAAVDGKPVITEHYRNQERIWPLQFVAPPDSGFTLTLTLREGAQPVIGVMSRTQKIPPLEGLQIPQRAAGIIPVQFGDVTLAYKRVNIGRAR